MCSAVNPELAQFSVQSYDEEDLNMDPADERLA